MCVCVCVWGGGEGERGGICVGAGEGITLGTFLYFNIDLDTR